MHVSAGSYLTGTNVLVPMYHSPTVEVSSRTHGQQRFKGLLFQCLRAQELEWDNLVAAEV